MSEGNGRIEEMYNRFLEYKPDEDKGTIINALQKNQLEDLNEKISDAIEKTNENENE